MQMFSRAAVPAAFLTKLAASVVAFFLPSRSNYVSAGKIALISTLFAGFFLFTGAFSIAGGGSHFTNWALAIVNGTTLPATVAQRDVGFPLLLILGGFTIWHSFIGITLIQVTFAVLMPVLVFLALVRASPAIAYFTGLASVISLAPYTYEKWIYHDQAYLFFNLLAVVLLIEFIWTGRFRTLMYFTLTALAASFSRSAGNYLFPALLILAYLMVRGSWRPYLMSALVFALGFGLYGWHRYEIFDMRHQQSIPSGTGLQAFYTTYVFLSDFGIRLSPDMGPYTKKLLLDFRQQLEPNPRDAALTNGIWKNDIPKGYLEKYVYSYSADELLEKVEAESNEDYLWLLYTVEADNDQFYLKVAAEIVRSHPWYVVKFSMRNLWHALFDPGYAITRHNTLGYLKTGNDFIPAQQGWGALGEESVTPYGRRLEREMEFYQLKTQPAFIRKTFAVVQESYQIYFDRYVLITSLLIGAAWIGAIFGALCWVFPRARFFRAASRAGIDKLTAPIIGASAFLLYEVLLTAVLTQSFYRYFHFTELYRMVIAGFGVAVIIGALSLIWPRVFAPTWAPAPRARRNGVLSAVQKRDLLDGYFGRRHFQWFALIVAVNVALYAWWSSTIIANAWGDPQINIVSATYGQKCEGPVPAAQSAKITREANITSEVQEICGYNECIVPVKDSRWGQLAPGCAPDLSVTYQCKGDQRSRTARIIKDVDGEKVRINCYAPPPAGISVLSATYGKSCRSYVPIGQSPNWVRDGNVTERVLDACSAGQNAAGDRCKFIVDNANWGDPAQGCGKDFSVSYQCTDEQTPRTLTIGAEAAGKNVNIDCRPRSLQILSATYGRSCSGYVSKSQSSNWVREGNVTDRVYQACGAGRNAAGDRCRFIVDNANWGDPAQGCGKDFFVSYQCKGDKQPRTADISAEAAGKSIELDCDARQ